MTDFARAGNRLVRAVSLHRYWRFRWYHSLLIWATLLTLGWGGSPYLMVYGIGVPDPSTVAHYTGSIRVEGVLQRTKTGWKPPKYFIQTSNGEVEFHCGYLPVPRECWLHLGSLPPGVTGPYTIAVDPYFGMLSIVHPPQLRHLDKTFGVMHSMLQYYLKQHLASLLGFLALLAVYAVLVRLAYLAALNEDGQAHP